MSPLDIESSASSHSSEHVSYELDDHRNQPDLAPTEIRFKDDFLMDDSCDRCSISVKTPRSPLRMRPPSLNLQPSSLTAAIISPVIDTFKSFKFGHSKSRSDIDGLSYQGTGLSKSRSHGHVSSNSGDVGSLAAPVKGHRKSNTLSNSIRMPSMPPPRFSALRDVYSAASLPLNDKVEDVCLPLPQGFKATSGFDFSKLDSFAEQDKETSHSCRNYYRPPVSFHQSTNRPLVPQAMVQAQTQELPEYYPRSMESPLEKRFPEVAVSSPFDDTHAVDGHYMVMEGYERRNSFTMDRFSFFAMDSEYTLHAPDISSLLREENSFSSLFDSAKGTWWLDCLDPTNQEIATFSKTFGIHPLTAEDIMTRESREKVELFKNYYFVCFHTFDSDATSENFLQPVNVYMVVFREGILTFHFSPIQHPTNVRRRIRQLRNYVTVSSDWICYAIIDDITDGFVPIIRSIEVETDVIEDSVFVARECDFTPMLLRIGGARQKVMVMLRLLSGKADVIKMFSKRCCEQSSTAPRSEIGLYLGDVQDHILTMHHNLSVYEKIFSRSHANYLAQLQVESVNSNNRITKVLGRVILIGTILVPLNLVTGLFGMNVRVPGQGGEDLKWFFGVIGFIIMIIILFSLLANKWLKEAESEEAPPELPAPKHRRGVHAANMVRVTST